MNGRPEPVLSVANDCLAGGGQMGELMRSMDWSKTSIGAVESWSPALRMMVRLLLANRFPLLLWWGPCYCQLYNDPYRPVLGDKHPTSMGQPASECFPEIWDVIGPLIDRPFNGGSATWMDDLRLEYIRHDRLEEAHFTVAYSPVPDETVPSGIGGVLATVHEITKRVVGERRGLTLRELGSRSGEAKTAEEACVIAAGTLARHPEDVPFALLYLLDSDRTQAHLAGAAGIEMSKAESPLEIDLNGERSREAIWPLAETVRSEAMQIVEDLQGKMSSVPPGPWSDPPCLAVVWPIRSNIAHQLAGLLVLGLSSRLQFDERYRDFCELVTSQVATAIANARAYEEERKRAEALAEIDRAKTAFFSNVSHEFRTPLTLMLGPLEDELRENSKGRERLEIVYRNSLRLLKLVNTLLDFARIEAGRIEAVYEPIDLAAATAELASVFRSAIEKAGLRLVVDCPPLPEGVYVDREMWEKIVLNLLSNAFKFTFEGEIKVSLCLRRERVELSVSDTGAGIPAAELSRIFERFHRVRGTHTRTHEGTGIGLSLVQELAKIHGGEVQVRSVEGQGATFTVTIPTGHAHLPKERLGGTRSLISTASGAQPFVEEALRWLPDDVSSSASSHSRKPGLLVSSTDFFAHPQFIRILFADDNADTRDYIRRVLVEQRYEVETVADGQAALERILANPPDLILADVMMPRLDGFGLLERIRSDERTRTLPFIMLSARAGEEACVESLKAGADDYLIKPFSARNLLARVRTHVEMVRLRRAAARALYESEKRFLELADSAPVMIWVTDEHGNLEFANKTYLKYFEVALEDVAGWRWTDFIHADDYESYSQQFLAASIARQSFRSEARGRRRDGEWRWFEFWAVPRTTESVGAVGMVGCSVDITERKRAEERIRELAAIVESSDDAIFGVTMEGIITRWNKGAEKIYGYTEAEVIGQSISILIPAGRPDEVPRTLGRLERGEVIIREVLRRRKDGQEIYVSLTISPIRNPAGQIIGSSTVARDVTERKRVERELRESEERFRELTENIDEVFWIRDLENTQMIYVSPAYERIWGRSCDSLYVSPKSWTEAIHPEDKGRVVAIIANPSLHVSHDITYRIVSSDGSIRWIRDRAFPVHDAAGRVIRMAGVAEDVTERRHLEMQLHQAQKMEAIGQLAGGVAHDFNNLLSVISGHSELLAMMSPSAERWRDSIAEIRRATELGSAATRQLLAFSCRQILEPQVLDLNAVVAEAEKMLRPLIGEDVRLATLLKPRISHVRADLGQLNQVILNLAVNARDAMPQGGSLTLETREVDLDVAAAKTHLDVRPSRYVLLTVTDTGWGIPADVQAHIFEPFFTNKAKGQGTGLGLSVVLGIIQQSGGHIDVESKPGVGTKFKIYLPAVQEPVEGPAQSAPFKPVGGSETVLLVEDEEPVRNVTTILLETLGYRVLGAENGQDALRLFEASREKIDLLMTDVVMPDLSGREVAEALRAKDPGLKVLFQSGYTDDTVVRWGVLHAEVAFLKKPITLDVLARKIREILDRS